MKIVIDNQLVEYKDEGDGKVILLLHGWGANSSTFNDIASDLSKRFRVIRLDFPGFGQSPAPNVDWFVDDYAKLVQHLLGKLKVNEVEAIVGHSFGGRVAIKALSKKYINSEKLILIGSAGVKPKKSIKSSAYKYVAKGGKVALSVLPADKLKTRLRARLYQSAGASDYVNSGQLKGTFLNVINEDLLGDVDGINTPTLLIWGENDSETPVADARQMLSRLKNGRLELIHNAGHFVYLDAPEKVKEIINGFLS